MSRADDVLRATCDALGPCTVVAYRSWAIHRQLEDGMDHAVALRRI